MIEFSTKAVLSVGCEYIPRAAQRGFDFDFKTTRFLFGGNAARFVGKKEDKGNGIDLKVGVAFGSGYVELVWLDEVLRIDKSRLGGKDVMNLYVYEGPVEICKAEK